MEAFDHWGVGTSPGGDRMRLEGLAAHRLFKMIVVLLLGILLTACGVDDGDDGPTATSAPEGAQPTVAVDQSESPTAPSGEVVSESSPTNTDMSDVPADLAPDTEATPAATAGIFLPTVDATPVQQQGGQASPDASPVANLSQSTPAPAVETAGASTPQASRPGASVTEGDVAVGDGTTGADIEGTPVATPAVAVASPGASPIAGSPEASVAVTGCEVQNVPPFTGEQTTFVLTSDVNFRTGPGADCALALDTPLGEFQQVDVIGGPVIREDDGTEWVQIRALDIEGWVAFEFLQPAP